MNTTNKSIINSMKVFLLDKSQKSDLKNRHLNNAIRISRHLIRHDNMDTTSKLSLLALERYYILKYLKSIRTRIEKDNKKSQRLYSLSLRGFYSYVHRKLKSVVKYISEVSISQKIRDYVGIPNVTILHCERFKNPSIFDVFSEFKCRIIEVYKYKIPNYIIKIRRKY